MVPVDALTAAQRTAILAGIDSLTPSGFTPIGLSLQRAAEAAGDTGSVVLISDGEDTCAPPDPCQVAHQLKATHPRMTISTVGFRTDPIAREQLACIAAATGGLFVTADDPSELTRRLQAATLAGTGRAVLTTTGFAGIELGDPQPDIVAGNPQFPAQAAAKPYVGPLGRDLFVIRYLDCDFVFDWNGTLIAVEPTASVTVDGVHVDDPVASAIAIYGEPVATETDDGTVTAYFTADPMSGTTYRMSLTGPPDRATTRISQIVLCRCRPSAAPSQLQVTRTSIGEFAGGSSYREAKRTLIARFGEPDSIADFACEPGGMAVGERIGWGDLYIGGYGERIGDLELAAWYVAGPDTPVAVTTPTGLRLGQDKDQVLAELDGAGDDDVRMLVWVDAGIEYGYDEQTDRITSAGMLGICE